MLDNDLQDKLNIIEEIDSDYSRFVARVLRCYEKRQDKYFDNKQKLEIVLKEDVYKDESLDCIIVDLNKIWCKPYFYNKMRVRHDKLVELVKDANIEEIKNKKNKFLKEIIYNKEKKEYVKPKEQIDIVDFIKNIENEKDYLRKNVIFIADFIDEETIYKQEKIKEAIEILKNEDIIERYSLIYDSICNELNNNFVNIGFCDFRNNKCIAQRKHKLYPPSFKNGCCYMQIRKCKNLNNGKCNVNCVACKLFSCNYLTKMGVGYYGREIIFLQAFFNKKQKKHFVFDFYKSKEEVLRNVYKDIN